MTRGLGDINALIVNKLFRLGKPAYNKTKWSMLFLKRKMGSRRLRGGQAILGCRVAQSARSGKWGSLVAKDHIDSEDAIVWKFLQVTLECSADSDIKSVVPLTPKISELPGHLLSCPGQLKLLITPSLKQIVFTLYYNIWTKSHSKYVSVWK